MLGYHIKINNEESSAAIKNGVLSVMISTQKSNDHTNISMSIFGRSVSMEPSITWLQEKTIQDGDEIVITIQKTDIASIPKDVIYLDQKRILDSRLENYKLMKMQLEKEGLL